VPVEAFKRGRRRERVIMEEEGREEGREEGSPLTVGSRRRRRRMS